MLVAATRFVGPQERLEAHTLVQTLRLVDAAGVTLAIVTPGGVLEPGGAYRFGQVERGERPDEYLVVR
jgi:hypothetical protein